MPNIVIVGAGFAGLTTWQALAPLVDASTEYKLVLISARPYFYYLPAACRMLVTAEGSLEDSVLKPLPDHKYNTGNKKLFVASVTSVVEDGNEGGHVLLDNGEKVEYSVLILTPGSRWDAEGPCVLPTGRKEALEAVESWRERFAAAKEVVVTGGGAVGLEIAGELRDAGTSVTVVHGQSLLVNKAYPDSWRKKVAANYSARGIKLELGEYIDDPAIKDGFVTTRAGKRLPADLVISMRGASPNTAFIASLDSAVLTPAGTVKVLPTLQVVGHERIFAGGDVIEWTEQKQAAKAAAHAAIIAHNVSALLGLGSHNKGTEMKKYTGSPELILIVNGKNGGIGYAGILWGITINNWLAKKLKSRSLLIDYSLKGVGLA